MRRNDLEGEKVLKTLKHALLLLVACCCVTAISLVAQVVRVDVTPSHATNHFVPKQTLGAGIDRIPTVAIDKLMNKPTLDRVFTAGWQPVTYRQNTELAIEAWHWNPEGTWSDPKNQQGYFTGSAEPAGFIRHSFGYSLPHRGITRDGGSVTGYSRLTDGDASTYWKSNPYLASHFTGEDDSLHPQWVMLDFSSVQLIDSIKIAWANPYALQYTVQYWTGVAPYDSPLDFPTSGVWQSFPNGVVTAGKGGVETIHLSDELVPARYVRIVMTHSSNTCDSYGPSDSRNCVGYAIDELYAGTTSSDGQFHDLVRHTADQEQTTTEASSVDSWHTAKDLLTTKESQMGFDLFYTSGVTQGLPAIVPIALIYDNPDNAAAEIKYLEARHYPISYVEMGEEADDGGMHTTYPVAGTYDDGAHHTLVTAYSVLRPDHEWSVMLVNRDQEQAHKVQVAFDNSQDKTVSYLSGDVHAATFGSEQYKWHPAFRNADTSHIPQALDKYPLLYTDGYADPDGPIKEVTLQGDKSTEYEIPAASIVVLRGNLVTGSGTSTHNNAASKIK
jgi:hypothetical protein